MLTALRQSLSANELVLNALKYAYPNGTSGPIRVALKRDGAGEIVLSVEDDGVGYDATSTSGLGGRIVKAMATKLEGSIEPHSRPHGTRVAVRFPDRRGKESAG